MNRLKQTLLEGKRALGCFLITPSADNADILAGAGFDCLVIDHEHSFGTTTDAVGQLRAMGGRGTSSMIRVPSVDPVYFQRALDAGFECVLCPSIESREAAEAVVGACRYPPDGTRGAGGGLRAADYGRDLQYYERSGADLLIAIQIETAAGVARLRDIAGVDGIDMVIIGPRDLSASIGKLNRFADPEVRALFEEAERQVLASGKLMGSVIYPGLSLKDMYNRGHHLIIAGSDVAFLVQGAQAMIAMAHS